MGGLHRVCRGQVHRWRKDRDWDIRCQGLCHTHHGQDPWVQLDLGVSKPVVGVKIYYRVQGKPAIGEFQVQVGDEALRAGDSTTSLTSPQECFAGTATADSKNVVEVDCSAEVF